ncbi:hypothetical protein M3P05_06360 [Sansalvadorimonas sp. 2012CJ34-2]|uniref:Flagellar hook-length control protein FliK n=1 Tax=Parendozoicomonas callyspongiae TaxID=2942213 RepID=A0ABT0PDX6_9GAMM|nr:hypothetical protein [Sansalvadorimonas sp. 2012CJ34-2]MCL6269562.1 hypothetical protein [Sansalvadorimonas sp. 2012CJ34-2]
MTVSVTGSDMLVHLGSERLASCKDGSGEPESVLALQADSTDDIDFPASDTLECLSFQQVLDSQLELDISLDAEEAGDIIPPLDQSAADVFTDILIEPPVAPSALENQYPAASEETVNGSLGEPQGLLQVSKNQPAGLYDDSSTGTILSGLNHESEAGFSGKEGDLHQLGAGEPSGIQKQITDAVQSSENAAGNFHPSLDRQNREALLQPRALQSSLERTTESSLTELFSNEPSIQPVTHSSPKFGSPSLSAVAPLKAAVSADVLNTQGAAAEQVDINQSSLWLSNERQARFSMKTDQLGLVEGLLSRQSDGISLSVQGALESLDILKSSQDGLRAAVVSSFSDSPAVNVSVSGRGTSSETSYFQGESSHTQSGAHGTAKDVEPSAIQIKHWHAVESLIDTFA